MKMSKDRQRLLLELICIEDATVGNTTVEGPGICYFCEAASLVFARLICF